MITFNNEMGKLSRITRVIETKAKVQPKRIHSTAKAKVSYTRAKSAYSMAVELNNWKGY